jgi:adenylate cyclase
MREERQKRRLAAILAAEVVGYGRLMEANEESTLRAIRDRHHDTISPSVLGHHGRIFKDMGEGFLCEFSSCGLSTGCSRIGEVC